MKKISILWFLIALLSINNAIAQKEICANFGFSTPYFNDFGNLSKGYGVNVEYRHFLSEKFALGGNVGYYSYQNSDYLLPLKLTIELHSNDNGSYQPYYGLGIGFVNSNISNLNSLDFTLSPTIGTKYPISENLYINSNAHINIVLSNENRFNIDINFGLMYRFGNE